MLNSGKKLTFENLCEMDGFSLDPFRERFTGTIDENCCLDPVSWLSLMKMLSDLKKKLIYREITHYQIGLLNNTWSRR